MPQGASRALGEWIPGEIEPQRANARGVLRTVPIRGLFYTAWANSGLMHCNKKRLLFDHLVGDGEHGRRNGEAERLSGRAVDDELEFGCLQHRQVGGLSAPKDVAGVDADLAQPLGDAGRAWPRSPHGLRSSVDQGGGASEYSGNRRVSERRSRPAKRGKAEGKCR